MTINNTDRWCECGDPSGYCDHEGEDRGRSSDLLRSYWDQWKYTTDIPVCVACGAVWHGKHDGGEVRTHRPDCDYILWLDDMGGSE